MSKLSIKMNEEEIREDERAKIAEKKRDNDECFMQQQEDLKEDDDHVSEFAACIREDLAEYGVNLKERDIYMLLEAIDTGNIRGLSIEW